MSAKLTRKARFKLLLLSLVLSIVGVYFIWSWSAEGTTEDVVYLITHFAVPWLALTLLVLLPFSILVLSLVYVIAIAITLAVGELIGEGGWVILPYLLVSVIMILCMWLLYFVEKAHDRETVGDPVAQV